MLPRIVRPSSAIVMAAGAISQAAALPPISRFGSKSAVIVAQTVRCIATASSFSSSGFGMRFGVSRFVDSSKCRRMGKVFAAERGYGRARMRAPKKRSKGKELELNVDICIEDELPDDPEIVNIAELRLNAPMAVKKAFCKLKDSTYKTRDTSIGDVGGFESVELSVMLCNYEFIRKLNIEWRGKDHATYVLSMSQHIKGVKLPILMANAERYCDIG